MLEIFTTEPGIQLYTGNGIRPRPPGKGRLRLSPARRGRSRDAAFSRLAEPAALSVDHAAARATNSSPRPSTASPRHETIPASTLRRVRISRHAVRVCRSPARAAARHSRRYLRTSRSRSRRARRISSVAHDARGEGAADEGRRAGDSAARRSGIQLVERSAARRRALRARDGVSAGDRDRRDVERQPHVAASRPSSPTRRAPSITSTSAHDSHQRYQGLTFWSPNINLFRDPRWGRGQETYGEDPFLTGTLGVQFIRGLQGDDPKYFKTVATVKHFAVHSGPEPERHTFDAVVSERDLRESYLPHFEMGIREGGAYSLMCAYNRIDGKPACGSDMLITDILRDEWKFPGYIVSRLRRDRRHLPAAQGRADRRRPPPRSRVKTGTDLDCGRVYPNLVDAVKQGLITESADRHVGEATVPRALQARHVRLDRRRVKWAQHPVSASSISRRTARSRCTPRASRWCCSRTSGNTLPLQEDA